MHNFGIVSFLPPHSPPPFFFSCTTPPHLHGFYSEAALSPDNSAHMWSWLVVMQTYLYLPCDLKYIIHSNSWL